MSWSSDVIDHLAVLRRNGVESFNRAWDMAMDEYPPSQRERSREERVGTLFDVADGAAHDESGVDFLHRVASDAWHGRRPVLAKLMNALEHFDGADETRTAMTVAGRGYVMGGTVY